MENTDSYLFAGGGYAGYASRKRQGCRLLAEQLLDMPISDKQIRTIVETVRPDGTWPGIDYVDVSRTAFQHVRHLNNLVQLAT